MPKAKKRKHVEGKKTPSDDNGDSSSGLFGGGTSLTSALFGNSPIQNDLFASTTKFEDAVKERIDKNLKKSEWMQSSNTAVLTPLEANNPSVELTISRRQAQTSSKFLDMVTSAAPYSVEDRLEEKCAQEEEDIPIPPDVRVEEIADIVRMHGFAVVRNVISRTLLDQLSIRAREIEKEVCLSLDARQIEWRCDRANVETFRFHEVASRCKGRMDVRHETDKQPFSSPDIVENQSLRPIIDSLLGGASDPSHSPILLYAGLILSLPGSDDQPWHKDGMPLFPELSPHDSVLPPYAINVFVPLSDQDGCLEAGPTEFIPGSHVLEEDIAMQKLDQAEKEYSRKSNQKVSFATSEIDSEELKPGIVSPVLYQGDALLYDYRVCHRGTSNLTGKEVSTGQVRRILYLMYARPWFKEHLNFGSDWLFQEQSKKD